MRTTRLYYAAFAILILGCIFALDKMQAIAKTDGEIKALQAQIRASYPQPHRISVDGISEKRIVFHTKPPRRIVNAAD